ncbi:hypothetical protein CHELA1G11_40104 [Hyphomicrobiales bacterium]|nr:hypothetical protein CHELA1G2_40036 [Hyphomicrobiales bacterium]CAH1696537.1 hypothetical protein CHELA1G11_40104 [Hyphomicrobiales bacterium]
MAFNNWCIQFNRGNVALEAVRAASGRRNPSLTVGVGRDGTKLLDPMVGEPVAYATGSPN